MEESPRFPFLRWGREISSSPTKKADVPMTPLFHHREEEFSWLRSEVSRLQSEQRMAEAEVVALHEVLQTNFGNGADLQDFSAASVESSEDVLHVRIHRLCELAKVQGNNQKDLMTEVSELRKIGDVIMKLTNENSDLKKLLDCERSKVLDTSSELTKALAIIQDLENEMDQINQKLNDTVEDHRATTLRIVNSQQILSRMRLLSDKSKSLRPSLQSVRDAIQTAQTEAHCVLCEGFEKIIRSVSFISTNSESALEEAFSKYQKVNVERKRLHNEVLDLKGSIRVFCRIRPFSSRECAENQRSCVTVSDSQVALNFDGKPHIFHYDQVFSPYATQSEVFDEASKLIISVMDGYNVCIFAYGQTGSGKTYTMGGTEDNVGLYHRCLERLFLIREQKKDIAQYEFKLSFVEIYNEQIKDLLEPRDAMGDPKRLEVKVTGDVCDASGTYIPDLKLAPVDNVEECMSLMRVGNSNRSTSATLMNEHSSRSHSLLSVHVLATDLAGRTVSSRLNLVDLAGSERLGRTGATGERLKEAQHISKSLSALGNCISALATKSTHVPFRDSKLTLLLAPALGPGAKALMLVCASSSRTDALETLCSLHFATRVRTVDIAAGKRRRDGSFEAALRDLQDRMLPHHHLDPHSATGPLVSSHSSPAPPASHLDVHLGQTIAASFGGGSLGAAVVRVEQNGCDAWDQASLECAPLAHQGPEGVEAVSGIALCGMDQEGVAGALTALDQATPCTPRATILETGGENRSPQKEASAQLPPAWGDSDGALTPLSSRRSSCASSATAPSTRPSKSVDPGVPSRLGLHLLQRGTSSSPVPTNKAQARRAPSSTTQRQSTSPAAGGMSPAAGGVSPAVSASSSCSSLPPLRRTSSGSMSSTAVPRASTPATPGSGRGSGRPSWSSPAGRADAPGDGGRRWR